MTASKATKKARCPICKTICSGEHKPFCSDRCAKIDLSRWFGEHYVLAGVTPINGFDDEDGLFPSTASGQGRSDCL
ncbi:DNA gyrase inhibitor YacG [Iodidimonas sp. MBR-22]